MDPCNPMPGLNRRNVHGVDLKKNHPGDIIRDALGLSSISPMPTCLASGGGIMGRCKMWERDKEMEIEEQTDRDTEIPPSWLSYHTTTAAAAAAAAYKRNSSDVQLSAEEKGMDGFIRI